MADALGTPGGIVSDEEHRIAMAGMIAPQTSSLAVRTGVLWGPGTTALVTGTAATGTMTYGIALHHAVTTRGTADGVYLGPNLEAATTVNTTAAPGANSRIDVIWVKQNDLGSSVTPDSGTTAPLYGVTQGTAAVSPTKPAIPVGAEELATATVAVGATSTNGAGVTITQTSRQTVARGARIPVRSQTERDALTTYAGLEVYRLDTGAVELRNSANSAWVKVYDPAITEQWVVAYQSALAATDGPITATTWATLRGPFTSPVVPVGRSLEVEWSVPIIDTPANSGLQARLMMGGASRDGLYLSNSNAASLGAPGRLRGTVDGAGAAVTYSVDVQKLGTGSGPSLATFSVAPSFVRYRIV